MNNDEKQQPPIEIPLTSISIDALTGMIDAFILREGTDYGINEVPHESKVKQVTRQLQQGDVRIVFDPSTETATLITNNEWKKVSAKFN